MAKYPYARDCSGILRTNPPYPRPITQRYYSAYLLVLLNSRDTKTTTEKKSGIHPYTTGNLFRTSIPEKMTSSTSFFFWSNSAQTNPDSTISLGKAEGTLLQFVEIRTFCPMPWKQNIPRSFAQPTEHAAAS